FLIKSSIESGGKQIKRVKKSINATKLDLSGHKRISLVSNKGVEERNERDKKDFVKASLNVKKEYYDQLAKKRFKGKNHFLVNFEEKEEIKQPKKHYFETQIENAENFKKESEQINEDESTDEELIRKDEEKAMKGIRRMNRQIRKIRKNDFQNTTNNKKFEEEVEEKNEELLDEKLLKMKVKEKFGEAKRKRDLENLRNEKRLKMAFDLLQKGEN
ncbi:hypothetical protein MHBO_004250, partial [Bonamia ostreae]